MISYCGIVHKDGDSAYGIFFPDLPGCFSAADAQEDLGANAIQAVTLWFEDHDPVPATPADEIERQYADHLNAGATIMRVPRLPPFDVAEYLPDEGQASLIAEAYASTDGSVIDAALALVMRARGYRPARPADPPR